MSMPSTKTIWILIGVAAVSAYMTTPVNRLRRPFSLHSNASPEEWDGTNSFPPSNSEHKSMDSSPQPSFSEKRTDITSFGNRSPITFTQSSYHGGIEGVGGIHPLESISPSPQRVNRMKRQQFRIIGIIILLR